MGAAGEALMLSTLSCSKRLRGCSKLLSKRL